MDQILSALPKSLIAIIAMVLGLLFLHQVNPPVTICEAQLEIFRDSQKRFLYSQRGAGDVRGPAMIDRLNNMCLSDGNSGGCVDMFNGLKKVIVDLRNIPDQCREVASEEPVIKKWLWHSMKIMVQMAWGDRAPASYMQRNGWLDSTDLTLFCELKRAAIRFYGQERFAQWQEGLLTGMPKADGLGRDQVWPRSLLSTSCDSYR